MGVASSFLDLDVSGQGAMDNINFERLFGGRFRKRRVPAL